MDWFIEIVKIAIPVAIATTFDDNIYLTGFFSEVNRTFRPVHIVVGELFGFTVLITISMIGFLVGLAIPPIWIGLLGLLPIFIGVNNLINLNRDNSREEERKSDGPGAPGPRKSGRRGHGFDSQRLPLREVLFDRQTYKVSAVTISNGGNNLGIYIPLFASSTLQKLLIIIPICYITVCTWLFLSYHLTRQPGIAVVLSRYAGKLFPFVLMWLGLRIILDNESYRLFLPGV